MKKYYLVIVFTAFLLLSTSCENNDNTNYTIPTGGTSGVLYSIGAAFSQLVNESNEIDIQFTNQVSGGAIENVRLIEKKEADFSLFGADVALEALEGFGSFEGDKRPDVLRAVFNIYSQPLGIVTLDSSEVNTISDLKGKKVAVGTPGSGNEIRTKQVLQALDMSYGEDFKVEFLSISEGLDGLRDNQVDAVFLWTGLPTPGIMDLASVKDIKMIPLTEEEVKRINKQNKSLYSSTIPGGTYEGVDEDILTVAVDVSLFVHKDIPESDVYQITKLIFDNKHYLKNNVSTLKELDVKSSAETLIELHPGSEKFFKEEGVL
ncbi:TAXI family TRAP transporter solute-binding subunit [Shouchella clausii]|uniref:TAXI family TRAP transporter solute-binding subunit n=1 Tax=Shouchella clausii TaxID=79880 RepID=UPI000792E35F|nr:TAXI family TRAP transporter solute-binding subunit [Shouchella clausii]KKI85200.1 hypothetical protein WZ76_17265 [Shouchella clausii]